MSSGLQIPMNGKSVIPMNAAIKRLRDICGAFCVMFQ